MTNLLQPSRSLFDALSRAFACAAVVGGLAALTGCSAEAGGDAAEGSAIADESTGETAQAIIGGSIDSSNPAVVAIRIAVGDGHYQLCSGALVASNVVLTARHCVSVSVNPTVECTGDGESANGAHVGADYPGESLHVFAGTDPDFSAEDAPSVREIFHPAGSSLCNQDIALLVLDKPMEDIAPLPVRLHAGVQMHETMRAVGYGRTADGDRPGTRLRKDGVGVLAVGAGISKYDTALGSHEFEVGLSICEGDSGGPAISEKSGAVVGVVSRGGSCTASYGHIYTQTTGFESLFQQAFAAASAHPMTEQGDVAPAAHAPGANASDDSGSNAAAGGCSASPRSAGGSGFLGLGLLAGVLLVARRRRASR